MQKKCICVAIIGCINHYFKNILIHKVFSILTPDYRNIHPLYLSRNNNLILYYMNICKYLLRGGVKL